jgi:hypothetical protein
VGTADDLWLDKGRAGHAGQPTTVHYGIDGCAHPSKLGPALCLWVLFDLVQQLAIGHKLGDVTDA